MATLVFTALGTAIGGPLGGALGGLIGNQLDRAVIGGGRREGPRLKELAVSTSSYGTPVPRQFGVVRTAGTIVWATNLVESSETSGGHKGAPSTKTYSYSASFAVALASRPIVSLGRIWADGNLLRGAAGDLKTGGTLRIYTGRGDQPVDPLIAADRGGACPAFRDFAYCVFESLQLADFGNRVPALTFEVIADADYVSLADIVAPLDQPVIAARGLPGLLGISDEGGPVSGALASLDALYPIGCDVSGAALVITAADAVPFAPATLTEPTVDDREGSFGGSAGQAGKRSGDGGGAPALVRYYDIDRDFQAGVQHAEGRVRPGGAQTIEIPAVFNAAIARGLVNGAALRSQHARETLAWRTCELDPAIAPGAVVRLPTRAGLWRIDSWEWHERGVELELRRLPATAVPESLADPGQALAKLDLVAGPTELVAFELPWDGQGAGDSRQAFAAGSSATAGWTGAALYLDRTGDLLPVGSTGSRRSVIGALTGPLAPSPAILFERRAALDVELASPDFVLSDASLEALAQGANRALVAGEVVQFATAQRLEGNTWRLSGLLRGRGGTEGAAQMGQPGGAAFVLLDATPVRLDPAQIGRGSSETIAALGLADGEPVEASLLNPGISTTPLAPVHPTARWDSDGALTLGWTRRARGAWTWPDGADAPLNEANEAYVVGIGAVEAPAMRWELAQAALTLSPATLAEVRTAHAGQPIWVRQVGSFAASAPLFLTFVP